MKFTSIFFKTNESILEIHLKDTNKRAKTYQVYLNIFHSEQKYLNDFVVKIHKNCTTKVQILQQNCTFAVQSTLIHYLSLIFNASRDFYLTQNSQNTQNWQVASPLLSALAEC